MVETHRLQPCVRHIATHLADGKSIYHESSTPRAFKVPRLGYMARSYSAGPVPVKLGDDSDLKAFQATTGPTSHKRREIVIPDGANLNVIDIEPGGYSVMHQTVSLDISICVVGVIDHQLDGGEVVRLHPGDHIVQRGTNHRWINASQTEPARLVAVTIGCEPFMIGDKVLKEIHIPHPSKAAEFKI